MEKNNFRKATLFSNVKSLLENSEKLYGEDTAFIIKNGGPKSTNYIRKSYKEFMKDISYFGTALFAMGYKDKRIAVTGRNSYVWAVSYFATMIGGGVVVPLDKELGVGELEDSLIRSEASLVVYDSKYEDKISKIKENGKTALTEYVSSEGEGLTFETMLAKEIVKGDLNEGSPVVIDAKEGTLVIVS